MGKPERHDGRGMLTAAGSAAPSIVGAPLAATSQRHAVHASRVLRTYVEGHVVEQLPEHRVAEAVVVQVTRLLQSHGERSRSKARVWGMPRRGGDARHGLTRPGTACHPICAHVRACVPAQACALPASTRAPCTQILDPATKRPARQGASTFS